MNVGKPSEFSNPVHNNVPKTSQEASWKKNSTLASDNVENKDRFEENTPNYSPAYAKPSNKSHGSQNGKVDFGNPHRSVLQMKNEALKSMVQANFKGQSNGTFEVPSYSALFKGNDDIMNALNAAEATSEGKDDYWGVDATAERIFTFAKSMAGDDPKSLEKMRKAFEKGFKLAVGEMGGKAPSISKQTYAKVNEMFDAYEKELSNSSKNNSANKTEETQTDK